MRLVLSETTAAFSKRKFFQTVSFIFINFTSETRFFCFYSSLASGGSLIDITSLTPCSNLLTNSVSFSSEMKLCGCSNKFCALGIASAKLCGVKGRNKPSFFWGSPVKPGRYEFKTSLNLVANFSKDALGEKRMLSCWPVATVN